MNCEKCYIWIQLQELKKLYLKEKVLSSDVVHCQRCGNMFDKTKAKSDRYCSKCIDKVTLDE